MLVTVEGGEADNFLVVVTFAVSVIMVIIDTEVDVATSASSTVRLSDVGNEEVEGGLGDSPHKSLNSCS